MTQTPIDLDAAQALVDATSDGCWIACYDGDLISSREGPVATITDRGPGDTPKSADAEFIAQARTLVPALIAELRAARASKRHWCGNPNCKDCWNAR